MKSPNKPDNPFEEPDDYLNLESFPDDDLYEETPLDRKIRIVTDWVLWSLIACGILYVVILYLETHNV